jgi:hypothetical protein
MRRLDIAVDRLRAAVRGNPKRVHRSTWRKKSQTEMLLLSASTSDGTRGPLTLG